MALLRRRETTRDRAVSGDRVVERTGPSPGIVRALFTLAGVAAAGFLLWLAQLWDLDGTTGFWVALAIVAGAGVALGFSQIFGGWTKWGLPTMSPTVFLVAFLPTLVLGGWILLARQPEGGWQQNRFDSWTSDLGVTGFVDAMAPFLPVIALVIGLVFAFSFDTTGPRTIVERERAVAAVPEEDVHDYRREEVVTRHHDGVALDDDRSVAEHLRDPDGEVATSGANRVERTDRL
jgi:hypothetical protein